MAFTILFLYLVKSKAFIKQKDSSILYVLDCVCFYCACCEAVTGAIYIGADINNIFISIFILAISYAYGMNVQNIEKSLNKLAWSLFAASFAYGIAVYIKFLMGADMFSTIYAYGDKNSAAQIFLSACVILFTLYKPFNTIQK